MNAQARYILVAWILLLGVLGSAVIQAPFTTDMSVFLPRSPKPEQQILVDQLRDGVASRLLMVGIAGSDAPTRAQLSRTLAERLGRVDAFTRVDNGAVPINRLDQAYVWRNRYLLSPTVSTAQFSEKGLHAALTQDLDVLRSDMEPLMKEAIAHDPTGEARHLVTALFEGKARRLCDGVWCSADGTRALLLLQTRAPGFDIDAQEKALAAIHAAFQEPRMAQRPTNDARLLVSGPGSFAVRTRDEMKHDVSHYSGVALALILGLLLWVYRSPRILLLTLAPVLTATLGGLAAVTLVFGAVHGITVGFGITLIGESIDYAIYLFVQSSADVQPGATLHRIWPTLRRGALVSVCGFSTMMCSGFPGFAQLGLFTVVGIGLALGVTRFVLPTLMFTSTTGHRARVLDIKAPAWLTDGRLPRAVLIAATCTGLLCVGLQAGHLWQPELMSLSPLSAADQAIDRQLRDDMGAPDARYLVMATGATEDDALDLSGRVSVRLQTLITQGRLQGFDAPDRYLPSRASQALRRAALPAAEVLSPALHTALVGLPFKAETFTPFLRDVAAAREAPALSRQSLEGTAIALKVGALLLGQPDKTLAVLPLRGVRDAVSIAAAVKTFAAQQGVAVVFLDLKAESDALLSHYRHEALALNGYGLIVITGLLLIFFRSPKRVAQILAPLLVATVLTVAILVWPHGRLSIFHLFGLLLIIAVGSNYCLFFQNAAMAGAKHSTTLASLLIANACTVIGFGALSFSRIPVLRDLGETVALGTALSLIAAMILTPAAQGAAPELPGGGD